MHASAFEFLTQLLEAPGPVGKEGPVQEVFRSYLDPYADEFIELAHGSVAAVRNPGGSPRAIVTGHADEIGLIVHHVCDKGYLYFRGLGGVDPATLAGASVEVHGRTGAIPGVLGRKPIHLQEPEERTKVDKVPRLYVDIGASSKKDAERRVRPGDGITFRRGVTRLGKDKISSKALDNRAGVFCAAEALRRVGRAKPKACVIALSTVGEEIGGDGAFTAAYDLEPDVAIAIDVTFASDQPGVTLDDTSECTIGGGPAVACGPRLNESVLRRLEAAAKKAKIPLQYDVLQGRTGTDGDPIYRTRGGTPLGIVAIPSRSMPSPVELLSLSDLDQVATLLATFLKDLGPKTSFEPFPR